MADVKLAVRSFLLSKSAIQAIIGQRFYVGMRRQGATLPHAVISKISGRHEHNLSDVADLAWTRLQIECYSDTSSESDELAKAIIQSGIAAVKGATNGVDIRGVRIDRGQENFVVSDSDGGDDHTYLTELDLEVSYRE